MSVEEVEKMIWWVDLLGGVWRKYGNRRKGWKLYGQRETGMEVTG